MTELIPAINEVVLYGLFPNLETDDKERKLAKALVKIYSLYFDLPAVSDNNTYAEFEKPDPSAIRYNVVTNFSDFGFYNTVLDITDIDNLQGNAIGDATDDLSDIITDLLEIKWRIENNNYADGICYFGIIFPAHTEQHILDLLNYLKQKND